MIIPDVNLLIYATDRSTVHHAAALRWWSGALAGPELVGLAWTTNLAFVRLTTNPRIVANPLTAGQAVAVVEQWRSHGHVVTVEPSTRHLDLLAGLLAGTGAAGNLVMDAHLAALALEHGATLCSADTDFGRFPGLSWVNPLAS